MMKKYVIISLIGMAIFILNASEDKLPNKKAYWSFDGVFGKFDRQAIQRGFQVYKEVCAACHGLNNLYYRDLARIGFSEAEIKAIAAQVNVIDGPNENGEMYERPGKPFDRFKNPYANEKAARAANNSAYPVDLSLIIKARPDGANYVYSLLTGYGNEPPKEMHILDGLNFNPYFAGMQIAMPAPLTEGMVEYQDGTKASVDQMSRDLVHFLQFAAEPEMEDRKSMGIKAMLYIAIMTILFVFAKKKIWSRIKR